MQAVCRSVTTKPSGTPLSQLAAAIMGRLGTMGLADSSAVSAARQPQQEHGADSSCVKQRWH